MTEVEYGPYDKLPAFYENTVVELSVPSGKLIVADNLRGKDGGFFDLEPEMSINYGRGLDAWARDYAEKKNMGYAFVGNTCPSIVRRKDGVLEVVTGGWDEETDTEIPKHGPDDEVVAGICTDLWATMITDYQHWLDNGGSEVEKANEGYSLEKYQLIDVESGQYRWTIFSHNDKFDTWDNGRLVFAELELIQGYLPNE